MNSYDNFRAMLLGVIVGMASFSLLMVIIPEEDVKPSPPDQKFEVVDTYKGCDVVRWTNSQLAEYKYFLDCSNKQN